MPGSAYTAQIIDWFNQTIAGSPLWAGIGLAAAGLVALYIIWILLKIVGRLFGAIRDNMASRRRRQTQGYTLGVAPLPSGRGRKISKALIQALQAHMSDFSFGAVVDVIRAPAPSVGNVMGQREVARKWLRTSSSDLIAWGYRERGKRAPFKINMLSCEGSLTPAEARSAQVQLPHDYHKASATVQKLGAYLVARSLQPGLAAATAFKAEKLVPVAKFLAEVLSNPGSLPVATIDMVEADYCAMGLHIGGIDHLQAVAALRRGRLAREDQQSIDTQIEARIDLGRALLAMSGHSFDPVRVREAMDHLKAAVDMLRDNPTIRLASQTSAAVQQGQAMLQNRQRFSVTGGSSI